MLLRAANVATAVVVAVEDAFISFAVLAQLIFLDVAIDARSLITGGDGAVAALALSRWTGVVQLAFGFLVSLVLSWNSNPPQGPLFPFVLARSQRTSHSLRLGPRITSSAPFPPLLDLHLRPAFL